MALGFRAPQSLEYCPGVLEAGLALSRETQWPLYQFGLGPCQCLLDPVCPALGAGGAGLQGLSSPVRRGGAGGGGGVGEEIVFSWMKSVRINRTISS